MALKQLEQTTVEVSGVEYRISPFPAFKAANLSGELADVLAPIFAAVVPLLDSMPDGLNTDLSTVDVNKAAGAISNLRISGDRIEVLMRKLLLGGNIVVDYADDLGNKEPQKLTEDLANEVFCGDVQDMFVLCFKVIQLNFSGFFAKLGNRYGAAKSPKKAKPRKIL